VRQLTFGSVCSAAQTYGGVLISSPHPIEKNRPIAMLISAVANTLIDIRERASPGKTLLFFMGFLFAVTCLALTA
jgi:hypothetical protein